MDIGTQQDAEGRLRTSRWWIIHNPSPTLSTTERSRASGLSASSESLRSLKFIAPGDLVSDAAEFINRTVEEGSYAVRKNQ